MKNKPSFTYQLLMASRPFSWINTAFPFAAAYLLAGGGINAILIIGTLFFLFPYNLVMYGVNDVYDYDSDIRNPRKGGVEGALVPRQYHQRLMRWIAALSLPWLVVLSFLAPLLATIWLLILMIDVIGYSAPPLRLKERPVLDSISSSLHFVGPAIYALLITGFESAYWYGLAAFFLWGMASHAFGAIQDIEPDRDAGLSSIATVFGSRLTSLLCVALFLLTSAIIGLTYGFIGQLIGAILLAYPAVVILAAKRQSFHKGWRGWMWLNLIVGFLITQILIWQFIY